MAHDFDSSAEHLGALCKIKLSEEEKKTLGQSLKKVIKYTALLNEVDIQGVSPCTNILETMTNVMGEDEENPPFDREAFFRNVPDHIGGMIKVPPVIQFEE